MPPAKRRLVPQPVFIVICGECGCKQNLPARVFACPPTLECRRCLAELTTPGTTPYPGGASGAQRA